MLFELVQQMRSEKVMNEPPANPGSRMVEANLPDQVDVAILTVEASLQPGTAAENIKVRVHGFLTMDISQPVPQYCFTRAQDDCSLPLRDSLTPVAARLYSSSPSESNLSVSIQRSSRMECTGHTRLTRRLRRTRRPMTTDEENLLIHLKEECRLPWAEIASRFYERNPGSLQVHYSTITSKLKRR